MRGYEVRECRNHFHVTSGGMDLIGGYCKTREDAEAKVARLNAGEDFEAVLGSLFDHLFRREGQP